MQSCLFIRWERQPEGGLPGPAGYGQFSMMCFDDVLGDAQTQTRAGYLVLYGRTPVKRSKMRLCSGKVYLAMVGHRYGDATAIVPDGYGVSAGYFRALSRAA
jgi:hypothetical protein